MNIDIDSVVKDGFKYIDELGEYAEDNLKEWQYFDELLAYIKKALEQQQKEIEARDEVIREFINLIPKRKNISSNDPYDVLEISLVLTARELLNIKGDSDEGQ
jgi:phosphosulfolactate synthase (CoM biosynthesis protein A)